MEYKDLLKLCSELRVYAEIDGTEIGELCTNLIDLVNYTNYMISDELKKFLELEIINQLNNFKNNSKITEREVIHTSKIKELEWNYEITNNG